MKSKPYTQPNKKKQEQVINIQNICNKNINNKHMQNHNKHNGTNKNKKQTKEEKKPWNNLSFKKKLKEVWIFQKSKLQALFPTFAQSKRGIPNWKGAKPKPNINEAPSNNKCIKKIHEKGCILCCIVV